MSRDRKGPQPLSAVVEISFLSRLGEVCRYTLQKCAATPYRSVPLHLTEVCRYTLQKCAATPYRSVPLHRTEVCRYTLQKCAATPYRSVPLHLIDSCCWLFLRHSYGTGGAEENRKSVQLYVDIWSQALRITRQECWSLLCDALWRAACANYSVATFCDVLHVLTTLSTFCDVLHVLTTLLRRSVTSCMCWPPCRRSVTCCMR